MTGQFIIAGSPSVGACHAERYPHGASWCQLNHIKKSVEIVSVSTSTYSECVYIPHRNHLNQKL
ncbi:hypothetical protein CV713_05235 [Streptococcus thermophilus]|nr:hypothetical protein CV714_06075 [Streptococcus thermophilus]PJH82678.1 hypothetical protein CV713_05235 [Streptococcus thermophilus]